MMDKLCLTIGAIDQFILDLLINDTGKDTIFLMTIKEAIYVLGQIEENNIAAARATGWIMGALRNFRKLNKYVCLCRTSNNIPSVC